MDWHALLMVLAMKIEINAHEETFLDIPLQTAQLFESY